MRKLGTAPLSGAEKQRRHRDKVKARLAEAARLKDLLDDGAGFASWYEAALAELEVTAEERAALDLRAGAIEAQLRAALAARLAHELEQARDQRRKKGSSLLARLDSIRPREARDV